MKHILKTLITGLMVISFACNRQQDQPLRVQENALIIRSAGKEYRFHPRFTILYRDTDPGLAMRPAGIENVAYNVATWKVYEDKKADLKAVEKSDSQQGDGFDPRILEGSQTQRTPNYYNSGRVVRMEAVQSTLENDTLYWVFPSHELLEFEAYVIMGDRGHPKLIHEIRPKKDGYYSVGFAGAPSFEVSNTEETWQPLTWQEKRFPDNCYLTLAYRAPIPSTLVNDGTHTLGVLAAPKEFPFDPLPLQQNSRFAVMLRNDVGQAQPQLFAPILGGVESHMGPGKSHQFTSYLLVIDQPLTYAYEKIARQYFGFGDYRSNGIASLNKTFENIVAYGNGPYGRYIDSLKGFAYSTDVPGAVKNVSSLHPLELALVTDDPDMFDQKAYPMIEYMLSREKFLFSLDPKQKIQHPSRKMDGPIAPISELGTLYNIFNRQNPFLLEMAKVAYHETKVRNLDVPERGDTWINAMHLYRASGDSTYLKKAIKGADTYLATRVEQRQTSFDDPFGRGFFFWVAFTNRWIELLELYELTGERRYLDAAQDGARHYTLHTWMSPKIPGEDILVNKDGKAPLYWYLASKGHKQMYYPEEKVPAWRLSEIGLTPESSGTSTGHRGIFMANYAPWMLRIGHYAKDPFLKEVAKAAIIGRYRNFPGYHINTARTTAYEKENYPLHEHKELSVNSFHYNHILPMASMLLDYLVTDVWAKSDGQVSFPSEYIEGYAYLMNKFYGSKKGQFYTIEGVQLWMPPGLLKVDHPEMNYIAGRKGDQLLIAFTNQSSEPLKTMVTVNPALVKFKNETRAKAWKNNGQPRDLGNIQNSFEIEVGPGGITALALQGVQPLVAFQEDILKETTPNTNGYQELSFGNARAMLFNFGTYARKAYVYLRDDDTVYTSVQLAYQRPDGKKRILVDEDYPYEFTIPLSKDHFEFVLQGTKVGGQASTSEKVILGNR